MAFDGRVVSNVGVLAAVVEGGSFARAAEALGLSRSGVSRAVARLEARIGVRLLDRTTRAVALTDEGRRLYAEIAPLLTGIEDAVTQAAGSSVAVRGRLRVNVDAFFSRMMLTPHIAAFLSLHPDLSLELVAKDQLGDLVGEGFDIAVRFGTPPESSLIARKLLETHTITVAAPAYVAARGRPALPADLADHACIQVRDSSSGQPIESWRFIRGNEAVEVRTRGRLLVAEFGTMLGACLDGVGIARIKAIGVQHLIREGALVELLPDWRGESFPLHVLYPSRHLPPAKVRAFIDFLVARLTPGEGRATSRPSGSAEPVPRTRWRVGAH
ncbi:LysR family transcriptional regulator [Labrys wisconsinensis]|uniref:DNA-binding transcriptional LysR family regulator n=1 Tax=Labrys wisconsinensis TaxID=425677 RepID=A0ABU0J6E9_9HYPH|nr:LysR family transcriptional regulator [Labrys wisconsinensis]MDQ0469839.1 DNA-binding transcriptional LysR family regulator [Labrys wisconsinensis]